jgi:hypothetical protein
MLHLRSAPWLAKDVVWVAADASCGLVEGVAAWVAEYQQTVGGGWIWVGGLGVRGRARAAG